ncbi:AMP-binding protein [Halorientalis halophila]|uniref:AMP-binding protein n=1 Tax=Halorientalis halophila TaxID=3108499 RepID=UPI0030096244
MSDVPSGDFAVERESWPEGLSRTLSFPHGRRPLHEYVREHARDRPDAPAVTFYGRTLSWREFDDAVDAFAAGLTRRGHGPGDVCALFLQNSPQFLVAYHGAHRAGLAVTPLNPQFETPAVRRQLDDSGAAVLVAHSGLLATARPGLADTDVERVLLTAYGEYTGESSPVPVHPDVAEEPSVVDAFADGPGEGGGGPEETAFADLLAAGDDADASPEEPSVTDRALLQYTGGTTGLPKGCVHTHWNVLFKARTTAQVRRYDAADTLLGVMPLFHVAGKQRYCDALAATGCHTVLLARYGPEAVLAAVDEHDVTSTWLAVPAVEAMLDRPDLDRYDLRSLSARRAFTNCSSFGTNLTREISDAWREVTGARLQESGYGLTETHTTDTHTYGDDRIEPGFVGQPCYCVEVEIRDFESGATLPAGEQGEIVLRSPSTMEGYLDRPEATADVLEPDGFLHTGDVGRLTESGALYFLGRRKDTLKVSGHTVSPREVEVTLADHAAVDDVVVVGRPHESRGTVLEAHVVPCGDAPDDDALEAALLDFAGETLAEYKRPVDVVRRESFPRTDVGKVDRAAYRDELPEEYR